MTQFIITITVVTLLVIGFGIISYLLISRWLKIKEAENDISTKELYSRIDTDKVNESINIWLTELINAYIVYNIRSAGRDYITTDDSTNLIKDCTKEAVSGISKLYMFYIGLLTDLNQEDAVVKFVYERVSQLTLSIIVEFNKNT